MENSKKMYGKQRYETSIKLSKTSTKIKKIRKIRDT